jgi:hypothetical protein
MDSNNGLNNHELWDYLYFFIIIIYKKKFKSFILNVSP